MYQSRGDDAALEQAQVVIDAKGDWKRISAFEGGP
jgi:hypothetical protein